ncbi:ABC-type sugar transport system, permease component [Bacillus sp. OxB-1]|uniref:hypothetical protein n=1 Tax=Bacillus sp. (strain OxB-1) TaxID=98228 RepID=UPI00058228B7|nr:hypothetical protein [Bacillus sp. OxB-1]BAQ09687.1 ABC-type sugar transport system, permease component [Bacillus sp. OxB-1]
MTNQAMRTLFWGYLFIFFRVQIGIDWLADPFGYIMIATACTKLSDAYPSAKKAGIWAAIGIFISLPGVFVNLTEQLFGWWGLYAYVLLFLKTIVAYYLFTVLLQVAGNLDNKSLVGRTQTVFRLHIGVHLAVLAVNSFSMNASGDAWMTVSFLLGIFLIVMDIAFLLLIGAIRRAAPLRPAFLKET